MTKRILIFLILSFLSCGLINSQSKNKNLELGFTTGIDFEKKKSVILINFGADIIEKFTFGIKMGARVYEDDLNELLYNEILKIYPNLRQGIYRRDVELNKQTTNYITALYSTYKINNSFGITGAIGVRFYRDKKYSIKDFYFYKTGMTDPLQINKIQYTNEPTLLSKKNILKGYFSIGINYNYKSYLFGITADNIYSIGINLGKEF